MILWGLHPRTKVSIAQKGDIKSVADILEFAKVAESAGLGKDDDSSNVGKIKQVIEEVQASRQEVQRLSAQMAKMLVKLSG